MKKIMMAAAIVCATVGVQAATANWKVSANNIFNGSGSTDASAKYSGSVYFFNGDAISQADLFALFAADSALDMTTQVGYLDTGTVATGVINMNTKDNQFGSFDQASGAHNFFFVIVDGDKMYLSATKAATAGGSDAAVGIAFSSQNNSSSTFSATAPSGDGFQGVGYWSVAPEPTSGLLLLLGMAGLALKRKRA